MDQDFRVMQGKFCIDVCADREEAERVALRTAEGYPDRGEVSVVPVPRVELTREEEAEFTAYNAAAFDLLRVELKKKDTNAACWLVMSTEARVEAREELALTLRSGPMVRWAPLSMALLECEVGRHLSPSTVARWRDAELHHKKLRIAGNPRAWFC